jgi:asparagine synthase (glutamine-hydrolysing)
MCGIVGVAASRPVSSRDWLRAGCDAIAHRGPDDAGEYWTDDGRVGMGHRRLSIVDLSPQGHQPMHARMLSIVFNGEIYNHRELRVQLQAAGHSFHSTSDTEVLLAAYSHWGQDFLGRINGMFAFALLDRGAGVLLLARDRAGEKPLYYRLEGGELRFASELKALLCDPSQERRIDPHSLDCYLTMGYVPGERCIFQGMRKLPAGHALAFRLDAGAAETWAYWSPPEAEPDLGEAADGELLDALEQHLQAAVQRQLIADVPVALLLSGGVDSSLITAMAARGAARIRTFTVGFRDNSRYDESTHANLIAEHFGTQHQVLQADEVTPELLPRLARQYDEPIVDSSMLPTYLVTQQIARHCKVALGGDGGDELFGGYYSASRMAELQQRYAVLPLSLRRGLSRVALSSLPPGARFRTFLGQLGADADAELPLFAAQFDGPPRRRLLRGLQGWDFAAESIRAARVPSAGDGVQRITRFDFANYMAEDILVKVDRASMLNSLEVRSPFLDLEVVDFAFRRVPSRLKATPQDRKIILKRLAARVLPAGFDLKRKQGFGIPLDQWLRAGPWRRMFEQVLLDPGAVFDRTEVLRLFRALEAGRPVKEQLFCLAFFELWRRSYGATL